MKTTKERIDELIQGARIEGYIIGLRQAHEAMSSEAQASFLLWRTGRLGFSVKVGERLLDMTREARKTQQIPGNDHREGKK